MESESPHIHVAATSQSLGVSQWWWMEGSLQIAQLVARSHRNYPQKSEVCANLPSWTQTHTVLREEAESQAWRVRGGGGSGEGAEAAFPALPP